LLLEDAFPQEIARLHPLPLHLMCVAANDMSGDRLGTALPGGPQRRLSVNGISLGDDTAKLDDLRFSSALTASAAAFNSQMGRISIDLGPSVTFLMSALNLRLGLWVPHPSNRYRGDYLFPGGSSSTNCWAVAHDRSTAPFRRRPLRKLAFTNSSAATAATSFLRLRGGSGKWL